MSEFSTLFIEALKDRNREAIRKIPKSDLHNHIPYGGNRTFLEMVENRTILRRDSVFCNILEMNKWCKENIKIENDYQLRVLAGYIQAKHDGIRVLAPNFAFCALKEFKSFEAFIDFIKKLGDLFSDNMQIYPELCLDRNKYDGKTEKIARKFLETGVFKSIDLVGDECLGIDEFVGCYKIAEAYGVIKKAHVGEFTNYKFVIDAVRKLRLDCIQHGIALSESDDAMNEVKEKNIMLCVCPSSNLMLSRVARIEEHPIARLYHHGIRISVGSDDVLIFNSSVTNEYLKLTKTSLTETEINSIRLNGLNFYN